VRNALELNVGSFEVRSVLLNERPRDDDGEKGGTANKLVRINKMQKISSFNLVLLNDIT
jgi:hypothetical protein